VFGQDQFQGPPRERVAGQQTWRVLANTLVHGTSRDAGAVATVGAKEDVNRGPPNSALPSVRTYRSRLSRQHARVGGRPSRPLRAKALRGALHESSHHRAVPVVNVRPELPYAVGRHPPVGNSGRGRRGAPLLNAERRARPCELGSELQPLALRRHWLPNALLLPFHLSQLREQRVRLPDLR
jgi:hypothetical protein